MAKLGDLTLEVVEEESIDFSNNLISKPIEDRQEITDHITHQPININLKFVVAGYNASDSYDALIKMHNSNQVYEYWGVQGYYNNMAIQSLSIPRDVKISNGFQGTLKLQQVQVVKQKSMQVALGKDPATGNQAQANSTIVPHRAAKADEING